MKNPDWQSLHEGEALAFVNLPPGHTGQNVFPSPEYRPLSQAMHVRCSEASSPSTEKGQSLHDVDAIVFVNLPPGHTGHGCLAFFQNVPLSQATHVRCSATSSPSSSMKNPDWQSLHDGDAIAFVNLPPGQTVHGMLADVENFPTGQS